MSTYTAIKRTKFAGVEYMPGDVIPESAIPANRVGAVIRMGLVTEQTATAQSAEQAEHAEGVGTFTVPIIFDSGDVEQLPVTPVSVEEAITVLQMNADGATEHIADMTDDAALILIDACDSRKTVKAAAKARAAAIEEANQATTGGEPGKENQGAAESAG